MVMVMVMEMVMVVEINEATCSLSVQIVPLVDTALRMVSVHQDAMLLAWSNSTALWGQPLERKKSAKRGGRLRRGQLLWMIAMRLSVVLSVTV
jgi:hypothetical protein